MWKYLSGSCVIIIFIIILYLIKPVNDMGQNLTVVVNDEYYKVISGPENIHIEDSYKIKSKKDMESVLNQIKEQSDPESLIHSIKFKNAISEWRSHNLLYNLHMFRSHTKDVDINTHTWFVQFMYDILSLFYF